MRNQRENKKGAANSTKVAMILILFAILISGGLLAVDINFNSVIDNPQKISIFTIEKISDDIYKINLMGNENDFNAAVYEQTLKKTGEFVLSGFNNAKDFISVLLDQAKRCSTIIVE